jgi:hypothetical protein
MFGIKKLKARVDAIESGITACRVLLADERDMRERDNVAVYESMAHDFKTLVDAIRMKQNKPEIDAEIRKMAFPANTGKKVVKKGKAKK